jgi:hypothetical protein
VAVVTLSGEEANRYFVSYRLETTEDHKNIGSCETKSEKAIRSWGEEASEKRQTSVNREGNWQRAKASENTKTLEIAK